MNQPIKPKTTYFGHDDDAACAACVTACATCARTAGVKLGSFAIEASWLRASSRNAIIEVRPSKALTSSGLFATSDDTCDAPDAPAPRSGVTVTIACPTVFFTW